jgi:hypothetical protein
MKRISETLSIGLAAIALAACSSTGGESPQSASAASPAMSASGSTSAMNTMGSGAAPSPMAPKTRTGTAPDNQPYLDNADSGMSGGMASNSGMGSRTTSGSGSTGQMAGTGMDEEEATKALNLLMSRGYGEFSDFKPHGNDFTAVVNYQGRRMPVLIDPSAGKIMAFNNTSGGASGGMSGGSSMPSGTMRPSGSMAPSTGNGMK